MYNRKWTDAIWVTGWHKQTSCPPPVIIKDRNISLSSHATFKDLGIWDTYVRTVDRATIAKILNERLWFFTTKLNYHPMQNGQKKKQHLYWNNLQICFQANDLVKSLMASTPSYVRTIKPNETKLPGKGAFTNYVYKSRGVGSPKMLTFCQRL